MSRTPDDLVRMEVHYCVSSLVSTLASADYEHGADDLGSLMDQALELASPIDDWEGAAREAGWSDDASGRTPISRRRTPAEDADRADNDGPVIYLDTIDATWRDACDYDGIDPHQIEVYEHWIVSDWLAEKLEARGEKVDRDFAGMTVWARTTTGQAIAADSVIVSICRDLPGEVEAALAALKSEG